MNAKQKQKQLQLETLCRNFNQMLADCAHNAQEPKHDFTLTPPPSDNVPGINAPEPKVYCFNVLINGKIKHTIMDADEQKARTKAHWIAKQAAIKGWPSSVKSANM